MTHDLENVDIPWRTTEIGEYCCRLKLRSLGQFKGEQDVKMMSR